MTLSLETNKTSQFSNFLERSDVEIVALEGINIEVAKNAIKDLNKSVGWTQYNLSIIKNYCKPDHIWFASIHEEIVGYVTVRKNKETKDDIYYLPYIAVDSSVQGQQVGKKIMNRLFSHLKDMNVRKLKLDFRANNQKTVGFYDRLKNSDFVMRTTEKDMGSYSNGDPKRKITYILSEKS